MAWYEILVSIMGALGIRELIGFWIHKRKTKIENNSNEFNYYDSQITQLNQRISNLLTDMDGCSNLMITKMKDISELHQTINELNVKMMNLQLENMRLKRLMQEHEVDDMPELTDYIDE